jgi:nucleotide-binding universal stress UspA family protein
MIKYDTVLFCTDFSKNAQTAFPRAVDIARRYGAALHVLHVYYDAGHIAEFEMSSDTKTNGALMVHMKGTEMEKRLDDVCGEAEEALGAPCVSKMTRGKPHDEIVRYAKEEKIDLIVMSSHGLTGLEHALFGSTAERVLRHSPCDVLVVKSNLEE